MTRQEFINKIAPLIVKYAPQYNILCPSAVIAQSVLESDGGNSELAVNAHNYFGLKYRAGRCPTACGIYYKVGSEQNIDGSYTSSAMQWMKFASMEDGVRGYFDFINISNYANVKGVADPKTYLTNIKADRYATSINYVNNLLEVISAYNLTKYDNKTEENKMGYTNSSLVNYTLLSPNCTKPRKNKITKIVIHHMAGNLSVETCGQVFQPTSRQASSNYGIGTDGRVGLYVEECNRAWTSGNATVDNQAITIEVANDITGGNWHVSDKALAKTIELCADICKRNNIKELIFTGDKNGNLVAHRYYQATACPGEYLYSKFPYIANEVNKRLGVKTTTTTSTTASSTTRSYLKRGDSGAPVKTMQENLNTLGYNCGTADGVFGANTETALKKFQKDYKLDVDGMYGAASRKALEDAVAKKITPSTPSIYKVQKGDTLSKIGNYTGFAWKNIADLNNIKFPYVIKVGQILQLPVKSATHTAPFKVKLKCNLDIKKSPNGETLKANGAHKGIMYTIVEINGEWGLLKSYQKNRNGWINISDKNAQRV